MIENEEGLSMILILFLIVTLLSLVYAISTISQSNNNNLIFSTKASKAFYGAEAGIETALVYLNKVQPNLDKDNSIDAQLGAVKYQVEIDKDSIFKYKIKSQGHYKGLTKTVVAKLESIDHNGDGKRDGLIIASWREY